MPSKPRYAIIDNHSIFHVTWQCHNRDFLLQSEEAKRLYYRLLLSYKDRYKIEIYSYCFMSNHPHLTGRCESKELFSDFFRVVNSMFARLINKKHRRRGQVVMDRFKSPRIETHADLLRVMFYNDLNPSRAKMVVHPQDFQWSSFHYYAYGKIDPLITPSPSYMELGHSASERRLAYLQMVEEILKNDWKKKDYSSAYFIGNPDWVVKKNEELRNHLREKRLEWLGRYRSKFASSP